MASAEDKVEEQLAKVREIAEKLDMGPNTLRSIDALAGTLISRIQANGPGRLLDPDEDIPNPRFEVTLHVEVKSETTELNAGAHANGVVEALTSAIGGGLLTQHEPEAEIEYYEIKTAVLPSARR